MLFNIIFKFYLDIVNIIITKGILMLKYILIPLVIGIGFLNADAIQSLEKLEAEKKALELKLEAYTLKKKIIEIEIFFEKTRIERKEQVDREKALIQLKNDLAAKRNRHNSNYEG